MSQPKLYELDGEEVHWNPHKYQLQALESRARFTFLPKGWRGGFSSFLPAILEREMMRCGPGSENLAYFIIAPTLKVATKPGSVQTTISSYFCNVMEYAKYNQTKHTFYITPEGDRRLWGHEQKERTPITVCYAEDPDSFASATFLGGVADEVGQKKFAREAWNTLRSRMATTVDMEAPNNPPELRGMGCGRVWAGSTVYTLNWFVEMFERWRKIRRSTRAQIMAELRAEPSLHARTQMLYEYRLKEYYGLIDPEMTFIRFDSSENPTFSRNEKKRLREVWPEWFYDMRIRAIPRKPAGTIYEHFDGTRHVIPRFTIPENARRIGAVDFGKKNFYATVWFEDEIKNRWVCYAAYHRVDLSITEHGAKLAELFPEVSEWVAGQISEDHERAQLATGGLGSGPPAFKALWLGINNFASAVKLDQVAFFDDLRPERIPDDKATNFIEEIKEELRSYSRPINADTGEVLLDEDPEDKETYHWCDTLRYLGTRVFAGLAEGIVAATNKTTPTEEAPLVAARIHEQVAPVHDYVGAGTAQRFNLRYGNRVDDLF
jgi:hypothetical protein